MISTVFSGRCLLLAFLPEFKLEASAVRLERDFGGASFATRAPSYQFRTVGLFIE